MCPADFHLRNVSPQTICGVRADEGPAVQDVAHGVRQSLRRFGFGYVTACASLERPPHINGVFLHRADQHGGVAPRQLRDEL